MEQKLTKSEAKKAYWAKISKEDKRKIFSGLAKKKASKMSTEERRNHAIMMRQAKNK